MFANWKRGLIAGALLGLIFGLNQPRQKTPAAQPGDRSVPLPQTSPPVPAPSAAPSAEGAGPPGL